MACGRQMTSSGGGGGGGGGGASGEKLCVPCSKTLHSRHPCAVQDCKHLTEPFYTHCTFHFHQIQKEFHGSRNTPSKFGHKPTQRPYRTSHVQAAPPPRRRSPSSPRSVRQRQPHVVAKEPATPTPAVESKSTQPSPLPAAVAPTTHQDTEKAGRTVLKRKDATPVVTTAEEPQQPKRIQPQRQLSASYNPNVIVEYECGACKARNVVTREVRFLQTFVARGDDDATAAAASQPQKESPPNATSLPNFTYASARDDYENIEVEREVDAIVDCKNNIDVCEIDL